MPSDGWTWKFTPRGADQFESLDTHVRDRIVSKLDEVVESEWRDPDEFLEPLTAVRSRNSVSGNTGSPAFSTAVIRC